MHLSHELVSDLFTYEPDSGLLRWRRPISNRVKHGDPAGSRGAGGYTYVVIRGKKLRVHRVAWLLMNGADPAGGLDHANGDKSDNRMANLRVATPAENMQNTAIRKNNTSGFPGVSWFKPIEKWKARIMLDRKEHHLGYFESPEEAAAAYAVAKARLHTFQPTVRTV